MPEAKTNAVRCVETHGAAYTLHTYAPDGQIDGVSAAQKMGMPVECVYKTLVTQGTSRAYYVFVIPVAQELDRKRAAKAAGEKAVELIPVKELMKVTGYVRGGCSPIGMKKAFQTFIDEGAQMLPEMIVSGGRIGLQIALAPAMLAEITRALFVSLVFTP